jgi:Flp pilus assembly protein protease CpaA
VQSKVVKLLLACLLCAAVITLVVLLAKRLSGR